MQTPEFTDYILSEEGLSLFPTSPPFYLPVLESQWVYCSGGHSARDPNSLAHQGLGQGWAPNPSWVRGLSLGTQN